MECVRDWGGVRLSNRPLPSQDFHMLLISPVLHNDVRQKQLDCCGQVCVYVCVCVCLDHVCVCSASVASMWSTMYEHCGYVHVSVYVPHMYMCCSNIKFA